MLPESSARAELSLYDINTLREAMRTDYQIPAPEGAYICICHPRVIYGKNWRKVLRRIQRGRRAWLRYYCREAHRLRHLVDTSGNTERILGFAGYNGYFRRSFWKPQTDYPELKEFEGSGL